MAKDVNPPRGMRDFLPFEKQIRDRILDTIIGSYKKFGFQVIETPALEDISRLTSGQGGDNEKLAFRVLKRGEELASSLAGELNPDQLSDLGLRYDLTVPLTRYFATNHSKLPKVFKAIQAGPVWRAERPQKGRYRQFIQCDIDIIGEASEVAEVELLLASLAALDSIGLDSATIRVNHRALLKANIAKLGISEIDSQSAMITIDKLDKLGIAGVCSEIAEKFGSEVAKKAQVWLENINESSVPGELENIFSSVAKLQPGRLKYDPTLVRGMGYYTGAIFEIEHPGTASSIGGGGRYDGMVGRWLGSEVPAVGISIGFERVLELMELTNNSEAGLVLIYDPGQLDQALSLQAEAIAAGWQTRLELRPKNLKSLLEVMAEQGFTHFALVEQDSSNLESLGIRELS